MSRAAGLFVVTGAAAAGVVGLFYGFPYFRPYVESWVKQWAPSLIKAEAPAVSEEKLKEVLGSNHALLSVQELKLVAALTAEGQEHLFTNWPPPGERDEDKHRLLEQLLLLDSSYHGGLCAYIRNAKHLLLDSKEGRNPFEGYTPYVPPGAKLDIGSPEFLDLEVEGLKAAGKAAFVLVAGGLGERLGYSGIKLALPSESATGTCFLQLYCQFIVALQQRAARPGVKLPLVIMTSDDTHARTVSLLEQHNYFGMDRSQVTLLKQEKVACLIDNDAHLALEPSDPFKVQTKPHGHGDVHALLHSSGVAKKWAQEGREWVCFFQDTNALVIRGLVAALGVSARHDYDMNSLAVPRKAKEAIGAISLLKHANGSQLTINVEYNQLDPLLRSTVNPDGDVNDESGWSPFPGNINQLVLKLSSYVKQLERTGGIISEFVNPKYKDATKTAFKSSTRLECMMQDYPKCLPQDAKVGFTVINQVWASYSPVKNSVPDAQAKFREGNPTHSATTGEYDIYKANCLLLQQLTGAQLPQIGKASFNGLEVEDFPRVVLTPRFAPVLCDLKMKIHPGSIKLQPGSVLILDGDSIVVKGPLEVAGALKVQAESNATVVLGDVKAQNAGWEWQALKEGDASASEEELIRGFRVIRKETRMLAFTAPGAYHVPELPKPALTPPPPAAAASAPAAATAATASTSASATATVQPATAATSAVTSAQPASTLTTAPATAESSKPSTLSEPPGTVIGAVAAALQQCSTTSPQSTEDASSDAPVLAESSSTAEPSVVSGMGKDDTDLGVNSGTSSDSATKPVTSSLKATAKPFVPAFQK